MRIDVSEPVLCGCDTCVQHRTLCMSNTQETEPSNVIGSSVTSVPVSSEPVQALGDELSSALGSTSDQSSETETPLAPPVTTSVNPEPAQSDDSTIFKFPPVSSEPAQALAPTAASGSMQGTAFGFGAFAAHRSSFFGASSTSAVNGSSPFSFAPPVTSVSSAPVQSLGTTTTSAASASSTSSPANSSSSPTTFQFAPAFTSVAPSGPSTLGPMQAPTFARPDVGVSPTAPSGYFGQNQFSAPKNPFGSYLHPAFGGRHPSNLFGPNPQTTIPVSGRSPFWTGVETEQGSRYPRYAPTPDFDSSGGPAKLVMSISASNSHGHKSHEELRWEDYKNGDKKGAVGSFPPRAHKPRKESRWEDYRNGDKGGFDHSPSLFAPPSIPHRRPQMRTIVQPHGDMSSFPFGYKYIGQRPPD